jgi:hypothetical protein
MDDLELIILGVFRESMSTFVCRKFCRVLEVGMYYHEKFGVVIVYEHEEN